RKLNLPLDSSKVKQIQITSMVAGEPVGVITASQNSVTPAHVKGVHADRYHVIIKGMDDMQAFFGAIIKEEIALDEGAGREEMKKVIAEFVAAHPEIKAIRLECTNMPPYKEAIQEVTDLPIFDNTTFVNYIQSNI